MVHARHKCNGDDEGDDDRRGIRKCQLGKVNQEPLTRFIDSLSAHVGSSVSQGEGEFWEEERVTHCTGPVVI